MGLHGWCGCEVVLNGTRRAVRRHEEETRLCRSQSAMELAASSVILISSGSDTEDELPVAGPSEQNIESPHHKYVKRGLRGTKSVITAEMTAALDRSKVSDRKLMMIITVNVCLHSMRLCN